MDDSDDDLYGDIEFDDDLIAQIDAKTTQILKQQPTVTKPQTRPQALPILNAKAGPSRPPPSPPLSQASKRRRTPTAWVTASAREDDFDYEDTTFIRVGADGQYITTDADDNITHASQQGDKRDAHGNAVFRTSAPPVPTIAYSPPPDPTPPQMQLPKPQPIAPVPVQRPARPRLGMRPNAVLHPVPNHNPPQQTQQLHRTRTFNTLDVVQAAMSAAPSQSGPTSTQVALAPNSTQARRLTRTASIVQAAMDDPQWQSQIPRTQIPSEDAVATLQRQLAELRRANESLQAERNAAMEAKYAKDGEVTVLRRKMDQTAQEHSSALLSLREAKEAAEAVQAQAQRAMKDELERLRTNFKFSTAEQISSVKKTMGSVRGRRHYHEPPSTPITSSQMQAWSLHQDNAAAQPATQSRRLQTPTRPRIGVHNRESPRRRSGASTLLGARQPIKGEDGALPGFHNAFNPSPTRASSRKAKQVEFKQPHPMPSLGAIAGWNDQTETPARVRGSHGLPRSPPSSPTPEANHAPKDKHSRLGSTELDDEPMDFDDALHGDVFGQLNPANEPDGEPEEGHIDPPLWKIRVQHLIFSHVAPSAEQLAIQEIMTAQLPDDIDEALKMRYGRACSAILQSLGDTTPDVDMKTTFGIFAQSFIDLVSILKTALQLGPLTALLHLIASLCFCIPGLTTAILPTGDNDYTARQAPGLLIEMGEIVMQHMRAPPVDGQEKRHRLLSEAVFILLESLIWDVSDEVADGFSTLLDYLIPLVEHAQPSWMVYRTARLLTFIASRPNLAKQLLGPLTASQGEEPSSNPVIEGFCYRLIDRKRTDNDVMDMRDAICAFFATSCNAYPQAHQTLLQYPLLVVSLVQYLFYVSAPVMDEEVELVKNPVVATKVLQATSHALFLLSHLVMAQPDNGTGLQRSPAQYLKDCLDFPYDRRALDGIHHMFHVAFGRLSSLPAPYFLPEHQRLELMVYRSHARDLLDCVTDNEQGDAIHAIFNEWIPFEGRTMDDVVNDILDEEEEMGLVHDDYI